MPTDPRIQVIQAPSLQAGIGGREQQQQALSGKLGERQMTVNEQQLALQQQAAEQQRQVNTQQMKMAQDKLAMETAEGRDRNRIAMMRAKAEIDLKAKTQKHQAFEKAQTLIGMKLDKENRAEMLLEAQQTGRATRAETRARTTGLEVATAQAKHRMEVADRIDRLRRIRARSEKIQLNETTFATIMRTMDNQRLRMKMGPKLKETQADTWAKNEMISGIIGSTEATWNPTFVLPSTGGVVQSLTQIATDKVYRKFNAEYYNTEVKKEGGSQFATTWNNLTKAEKEADLRYRMDQDPELAKTVDAAILAQQAATKKEYMRSATEAMAERFAGVQKQLGQLKNPDGSPRKATDAELAIALLRTAGTAGGHAADLLQEGMQEGEEALRAQPWDSRTKIAVAAQYKEAADILDQGGPAQQRVAAVIRGHFNDLQDPAYHGKGKDAELQAHQWRDTANRLDPAFNGHALQAAYVNAVLEVLEGKMTPEAIKAELKPLYQANEAYMAALWEDTDSPKTLKLEAVVDNLERAFLRKHGPQIPPDERPNMSPEAIIKAFAPAEALPKAPAAREALKAPSVTPPVRGTDKTKEPVLDVVVPAGGG